MLTKRRWSAPEVLSERKVSEGSDVWSYGKYFLFSGSFQGIALWEMLENKTPYFAITSNDEVRNMVLWGEKLSKPTRIEYPEEIWAVMEACWRVK